MWPAYRGPHICIYRKAGKASQREDERMHWVERCRCGRIVDIVLINSRDSQRGPIVRKAWYDNEGNLERKTGDWPAGVQTEKRSDLPNSSSDDPLTGK